MDISLEQHELLATMGAALLQVQMAEKVIRLCMTIVLPRQTPLTLDSLQQQEESEQSKTIGYFLAELRKRTNIDASFDQLLKDFLKNRNDFVHDLSRVPNWKLRTPEQAVVALQFILMFIRQTDEVVKIFVGIILSWQQQQGISGSPLPENEWFSEVELSYKPLAAFYIGSRGT